MQRKTDRFSSQINGENDDMGHLSATHGRRNHSMTVGLSPAPGSAKNLFPSSAEDYNQEIAIASKIYAVEQKMKKAADVKLENSR